MQTLDIPLNFIEQISRTFGDTGKVWLLDLPETIAHCVQQWELSDLTVAEGLSYNLILFATHPEHGPVVLKIGVPHLDLFSEMEAIQLYDGHGICRCYAVDEEHGAMLLERVLPGEDLRTVKDADERFRIAADLFARNKTAVPEVCNLPTYQDLIERALQRVPQNPQVPQQLTAWLREIKGRHQQLVGEADHLTVLHCDLHHMNILRSGDGWKLIDPKGFIGVPAMECIRFMQNELGLFPPNNKRTTIDIMISIFAPVLEVDPQTIEKCYFIDSVLSTYWGFEDDSTADWLEEAVRQCGFLRQEFFYS
ncbi:MAG: aminoglycoside phosphotransferase family protein [Anaerolineae bacterium]|jgi:streptomycin 6-kinase|nr:aminoglycoside phosphotransferase family protein [Anaerolineae bacterium]